MMNDSDDDELGMLIRRDAAKHRAPAGLAQRVLAEVDKALVSESRRGAADEANDLRRGSDAGIERHHREHSGAEHPEANGFLRVLRAFASSVAKPLARLASAARERWQGALVFAAGAATCAIVGWAVLPWVTFSSGNDMGDTIADNHIQSLMASHLMDVASTDRHTVKPWFAGKLDFSPPVNDLADAGFPLVGGRLAYLGHRPVAALVYRSRQHVIDLYVWPASAGDEAVVAKDRQGYNLLQWRSGGMQFWAVSDLNAAELKTFAGLIRSRALAS